MSKRLTKNLIVSILLLAVVLAVVSGVAGYVVSQRVGHLAYVASGLAAFVVWLAGSLSLLFTLRAPKNQAGVTALLLAMLLRIGLPLVAVVLVTQLGSPFSADAQVGAGDAQVGWAAGFQDAGFFGLLVVHYLVALMVETIISVRWLSRQGRFSPQPCRPLQERVQQKAGSS